jgi:hypothetical protein
MSATVIDTPDAIDATRLLTLRQMLKLEICGMKHSRKVSAYALIKKETGLKGNKAAVLAAFEERLRSQGILRPI